MKIHALMFQVENEATTGTTYLIAWIDDNGYSKTCYQSHPNMTLLDVEPGHSIVRHNAIRRIVSRLNQRRGEGSLN